MATAEKWHKFKPLPADIRQRVQQLVPLFTQEGVLLAYLFGSLTHAEEAQDVDLALLLPEEKRPFHLLPTLYDTLNTERIDLVDLRRAPPTLKMEIIRTGQCLLAQPPNRRLEFELATIRQYQDTNYLRREQERLMKERFATWS